MQVIQLFQLYQVAVVCYQRRATPPELTAALKSVDPTYGLARMIELITLYMVTPEERSYILQSEPRVPPMEMMRVCILQTDVDPAYLANLMQFELTDGEWQQLLTMAKARAKPSPMTVRSIEKRIKPKAIPMAPYPTWMTREITTSVPLDVAATSSFVDDFEALDQKGDPVDREMMATLELAVRTLADVTPLDFQRLGGRNGRGTCVEGEDCCMFTCTCQETDEWFTGTCDECERGIRAPEHALRRPLIPSGWQGCYCSMKCMDAMARDDIDETVAYAQMEILTAQLEAHGILDPVPTIPVESVQVVVEEPPAPLVPIAPGSLAHVRPSRLPVLKSKSVTFK